MSDADNPVTSPRAVDHQRVFAFLRALRRDRSRRVSDGAKLVLHELVDRTDRRGGRVCDPSGADLADACGMNRRQVFRYVDELKRAALIRVTTRKARRLSAVYDVVWDAFDNPASEAQPVRERRQPARRSDGAFAPVVKRPGAAQPVQGASPLQRFRGRASGPEPEVVRSPEEQAARAAFVDSYMAQLRGRPVVAAE